MSVLFISEIGKKWVEIRIVLCELVETKLQSASQIHTPMLTLLLAEDNEASTLHLNLHGMRLCHRIKVTCRRVMLLGLS